MKPQLFSLLLLLIAVTPCSAQFKNNNNPKDVHFRGRVDSAIVTYYNIKAGGVKELNDRSTSLYNVKGFLTEERMSDFDSTDSRYFKTVYSYDGNGNYSEALDYDLSGKLKEKALYSYDPVKRLVEMRNVRNITGTMLLDIAGNIVEEVSYHDIYPISFSTTRYKYNSKGLCIESYQTWTNSTDMQKITYTYNADGNLVKETVINDFKLLAIHTYTYPKFDKKHNWLIQNKYQDGRLINVAEQSITYKK